jgi:hypothetical protein
MWFRRGLWLGAPSALLSGHRRSIVGAAGSEAARTALAAWDFDTVYQCVAVFDLLGWLPPQNVPVDTRWGLGCMPRWYARTNHSVGRLSNIQTLAMAT